MTIETELQDPPAAAEVEDQSPPAGVAASARRPRWAGWFLADEPNEPEGEGTAVEGAETGRPLLLAALLAVVALPILIVGVADARHPWYPAGDWADVALGAIEVGTRHTPLVGVYSRYGWNHPGPMMFWLYALPYRLLGQSFSGMILAASLINAASAGGAVVLAWRRGRVVLACAVAVGFAFVISTLGPPLLRDPWNPWVTVLPFGLLVVATWAAIEGDRIGIFVVAVTGAFLSQTHIGFVPLVAILTVVAAVGFWRRRHDRRTLLVGLAVVAVCWLPVLAHVLTGGDNVAKLVEHFRSDQESSGVSYALGITARELGGVAPWLGAPEPGMPAGGGVEAEAFNALIVPVLVFSAVFAVAWWDRRRSPSAWRFQAVVGVSVVAATFAVSRISGTVFSYLIRWWWPVAALFWASIAWSLWCVLGRRLPPRIHRGAVAGVAILAVLYAGRLGVDVSRRDAGMLESTDGNNAQAPLAYFTEDVLAQVPTDRPVMFRPIGPSVGWVGDGLALQLIKSGRDVRFEDKGSNRYKYGEDRLTAPTADEAGLVLMTGIGIDDLARMGGGRELGRWDPLTPSERREAWDLHRKLRGQFSALGREDLVTAIDLGTSLWDARDLPEIDPGDFARFHELRNRGEPHALVLYDRADQTPERT